MFGDKNYKLISVTSHNGDLKFDDECYIENGILKIIHLKIIENMIFAYENSFDTVRTSKVLEIFCNENKLVVTTSNSVIVLKPIGN